jgi:Family of unknown function (DUF6252)
MKKIILITTLAFVFMAVACVKNPPAPNCGPLPCPTTTGANVVSCLVNGVPYIAKGGKPDLGMLSACQQGMSLSSSALGGPNTKFTFYFCKDSKSQILEIWLQDSLALGEYDLARANHIKFNGGLFNTVTNDSNTGKIQITKLTTNVVSGNFMFNASNGNKVNQYQITQGNFDIAR